MVSPTSTQTGTQPSVSESGVQSTPINPHQTTPLTSTEEKVKLGKAGEILTRFLNCIIHEVGKALLSFCSTSTSRMHDSSYTVETTSRLAQWRIENLGSFTYRKSNPFKIGFWNWHLAIEKSSRVLLIKLYPENSYFSKENPPTASFIIRVLCPVGDREVHLHPEVSDKPLKCRDDFIWRIEEPLTRKFIIDVEFLDLKTYSKDGAELHSIWAKVNNTKPNQLKSTALTSISRMLTESIHTDTTITTQSTTFYAHRSILSSRSPDFHNQLNSGHIYTSILDVSEDMTPETCRALLNYIYGNINTNEFLSRRLELLRAADKYGIVDLKEVCHESLLEDIDTKNVLERLRHAWLFGLDELRVGCLKYLVKFGKVYDVRDEVFNVFLQCADRELIAEMFHEILDAWNGF